MTLPRLLIVGTSDEYGLEHSYVRAFRRLGASVAYMADDFYAQRFRSKLFYNRYSIKVVKYPLSYIFHARLLRALRVVRPELLFGVKGLFLHPMTLKRIRKIHPTIRLFCYYTDDPFSRVSGASNAFVRAAMPFYDAVFIWGRRFVPLLTAAGARRAEYLPVGYDDAIHRPPSAVRPELVHDVTFVGHWDAERERWLTPLVDFDLALWGNERWATRPKDARLRRCYQGRQVRGPEMSDVLFSARVSLNILRLQNKGSHTMRTFETPASRAFMLAERSEEQLEFFEEDREAVYYSSPAELREKLAFYIKHDEERRRIAAAGYERCVRSGYSYIDRAAWILDRYTVERAA